MAIALFLMLTPLCARDENKPAPIGVAFRIDQVVIPGSELEAKPIDYSKTPIVLRIVAAWPHGSARRYDLEYYGLEAGEYDLRDFLQRKDGSPLDAAPALPVKIVGALSPGQALPAELTMAQQQGRVSYATLLVAGTIAWVVGLLAILFWRGRNAANGAVANTAPPTLEQRLRPLVEGAMSGTLARAELADLERTLLALWRRRLHMMDRSPIDSLAELKRHTEAGPLLIQLENWLHRPGSAAAVDVTELLRPYRNLQAADWDGAAEAAA